MPGEGRLPHPEVQVGRVHTADLHIVILVDPVKDGPELLNVPNLKSIKSIVIMDISLLQGTSYQPGTTNNLFLKIS